MLALLGLVSTPVTPTASTGASTQCVQSTVMAGSSGTIVTGVPSAGSDHIVTRLIALDEQGSDRAVQTLDDAGPARALSAKEAGDYRSPAYTESGVVLTKGPAPHWRYVTTSDASGSECVASALVRVDPMKLSAHYALLVPAKATVTSLTVYYRDPETGGETPCATWSDLGSTRRRVTCSFSDMVVTLEPTDRPASKASVVPDAKAGSALQGAERGVSFRCANGDEDDETGICRVEIRTKQ